MVTLYVLTVAAALACSAVGCWPAVVALAAVAVGLTLANEARTVRRKAKARACRAQARRRGTAPATL